MSALRERRAPAAAAVSLIAGLAVRPARSASLTVPIVDRRLPLRPGRRSLFTSFAWRSASACRWRRGSATACRPMPRRSAAVSRWIAAPLRPTANGARAAAASGARAAAAAAARARAGPARTGSRVAAPPGDPPPPARRRSRDGHRDALDTGAAVVVDHLHAHRGGPGWGYRGVGSAPCRRPRTTRSRRGPSGTRRFARRVAGAGRVESHLSPICTVAGVAINCTSGS